MAVPTDHKAESPMRALLSLFLTLVFLAATPAGAACYGMNLYDLMPAADRDRLTAAAERVPFPSGNAWTATRGDRRITVVGTYHLDDPRHAATRDAIAPLIRTASALLVEAGPEEERQLIERMAQDPSAMMITEGPSLIERLPPATWERLKAAFAARGIPGFMGAKFQPWYATMILAVPPCAMTEMIDPKGLDGMLIDVAQASGVPVRALEPYDTVLTLFDLFSDQDQLAMIDQTLAMEDSITDFSVTLADAYFDGQSRLTWEMMREQSYRMPGYTREQVDAEMAVMEDVLMVRRNRAWIPVIEKAAEAGPLVVAFGALHLSGQDGVLNLLQGNGWTLAPLALP